MTTTAPPAAPAAPRGPKAAPPKAAPAESAPGARSAADIWPRWRMPLAITAVVLIGGIVIALLKPAPPAVGYLDPAGNGPFGTHALASLLAGRGHRVIRTVNPAAASAAAAAAGSAQGASARGGVTLVITSPQFLSRRQLSTLARLPGPVVIVEPGQTALAELAPASALAGGGPVGPLPPDCALVAARLAGKADMGGLGLRLAPGIPGAQSCYRADGQAFLIRYSSRGRLITLLGTGEPLTNGALGRLGNAALALNLLGTTPSIVWLVPSPAIVAGAGPGTRRKPLTSLLPLGADLVTIQLCIAVLLAALWRARRLGPLVTEQLPVVVRASETVEGHARLYQARRARGRAAAELRTAMLHRVRPAVGLAHGAHPDAIMAAIGARSGLSSAKIEQMLFGPAPGTDAALVTLAADLDALEMEVRAQ